MSSLEQFLSVMNEIFLKFSLHFFDDCAKLYK